MAIDINELTESELIDLQHGIVERLRFIAQMKAHGAMLEYNNGERVASNPNGGATIAGALVKCNE